MRYACKILLEHSTTHSLIYYLLLFSCCNSRVEQLQQRFHDPQSLKYLLLGPLHNSAHYWSWQYCLPIHEHVFLLLFRCPLTSLSNVLCFSVYRSCPFVKLITKYFIHFKIAYCQLVFVHLYRATLLNLLVLVILFISALIFIISFFQVPLLIFFPSFLSWSLRWWF